MINKRHPSVAHFILNDWTQDRPSHHLSALVQAKGRLADVGFHLPSWTALAEGERPGGGDVEDGGPGMPKHGWQRKAAEKMEDFFLATSVWLRLPDEDRAMLRSQGGPMAGMPFMCCPTAFHSRFDAQVLRVLFLRRFWLLVPPTMRTCRCGRPLDVLGHHCAACANVGVLGRRGFALESAAARVCREAGGRVSTNVLIPDLDIALPEQVDERRIEVILNGLPWFHGAQLAIDTTPLSRDGLAHARCANEDGAAMAAARRRKELRYPELLGDQGRARQVVVASEVGGRWSEESREFFRRPRPKPASVVDAVGHHVGVQWSTFLRLLLVGTPRRSW